MGWIRLRAKVVMALGVVVPALALAPACSPTGGDPGACEGATCDGGGGDAPVVPDTWVALDTGPALDATPGADAADAASTDDASEDAAARTYAGALGDAGDPGDTGTMADAADAAMCSAFKVNPETRAELNGAGMRAHPAGSFGCPGGGTAGVTAGVFELTRESHVTAIISHRLTTNQATRVQLRAGCGPSSTLVVSPALQRTASAVVPPGIYTFVQCDNGGGFFAEPTPTPVNTDTTCVNASVLPNTGAPMYDPAQTRYFKFTAGPGIAAHRIWLQSNKDYPPGGHTMNTGRARIVVRTACDDAASGIFDSNLTSPPSSLWTNGRRLYELPALQAGSTYWLVLSEVDPGLTLTLTYERGPS